MSGRWNPNGPDIAGDEWPGSAVTMKQLATVVGRGPRIVATSSQSIDAIATIVHGIAGPGPINMIADVYDLANPPGADARTWALAVPVSNASTPSGWVKNSSGVVTAYDANAYLNLDEVVLPSSDLQTGRSTQVMYQGTTSTSKPILFHAGNTFVDGDTGAGGASITSKRVGVVEVLASGFSESGHSTQLVGQLNIGGVSYNADSGPSGFPANGPMKMLRFAWYWNPATGLPWTNADAVALTDGTDAFGISLTIKSGGGDLHITSVMLQFQVLTERRVATGNQVTNPADRWVSFSTLAPANNAVAAWSKVSGHEYLILYSHYKDSDTGGIPLIDTSKVAGRETDALTNTDAHGWQLAAGGVPLSEIETVEGQMPTLLLVAGVASVDSLPYADVETISLSGGNTTTQRISSHSTQGYGTAQVVVGRGAGGQDAALVVRLKQVSGGATLAGPISIQPADIPVDGKFHVVAVVFASPASLTSGTAVYIEATTTSTVGWQLPRLMHHTASMSVIATNVAAAAAQGIGGTTDFADADNTIDYPWAIIESPDPPGGLTSSMLTIANRPALDYDGVGIVNAQPATIAYAHLDWTSTSLGADFAYYEIQRQDAGTWYTIARTPLEASSYLNDIEGLRGLIGDSGLARSYRIRVVNTDGGVSTWASFPTVEVTIGDCADVVVASNHAGTALAFRDLTSPQQWQQRQTGRGTIKDILGRDYPVGFWPAEAGGESFTRRLSVAFNDPNIGVPAGTRRGRWVFDPVIDLLQDRTVPYLSYSDATTRVWLVSPAVQDPGPTREEPLGRYEIQVRFDQVGVAPTPTEDAVPWVP